MNLKNLAIGLVSTMGLGTAVGVTSIAVKNDNSMVEVQAATPSTIYVDYSSSQWKSWNAGWGDIKAYFFDNSGTAKGATWSGSTVSTTTVQGTTYGYISVPSGATKVIFNAWGGNSAQDQTEDLIIPTDGKNIFFVNTTETSAKQNGYWDTLETNVSNGYYIRGNWKDSSNNEWSAAGQKAMTEVTKDSSYRLDNVELAEKTQFQLVKYSGGICNWLGTADAWSMDSLSYPVSDGGDNVYVEKAGKYNIEINNNSGWKYALTPVVTGVADGGYLRGTWTNGWVVAGQKAMTKVSNTEYTISDVQLSADGQVKIVTYADGVISWCEFHSVSSSSDENYPVKQLDGNAAVTNSGIYDITVTYDSASGGWDYYFAGSASEALDAAVAFATSFNNAIDGVCVVAGGTPISGQNGLDAVWSAQAQAFAAITNADAKAMLASDLSGSTAEALTKFQYKYELVYGLYHDQLTAGDFVGRHPSGSNVLREAKANTNALPAILVGSSVVSILAVGGYFFIKKKPF